jgi:hypothetical protein
MTKSATRRAVLAGGWSVFLVRTRNRILNRYITNRGPAPHSALVLLFSGTLMPKGLLLFKETDLRRAIKTFQKLGLPIARAEIDRDGKIVVVAGELKSTDENRMTNVNPWDEVLNHDNRH